MGEPPADPPLADAYWVEAGRLMAGPHPTGPDPGVTRALMNALLDMGIRCIINLTQDHEESPVQAYGEIFRELAVQRGLESYAVRFSLWDGTAPSEAAVTELLDIIDACLASDLPVYLHCMAGLGRTGVTVGCWLARHGLSRGRGAVRHIARLRRYTTTSRISSPTTKEQLELVRSWRPGQ